LRITAPLNLAQTIVPPIVERYLSKNPKASIELIVSEKKLDLLAEGIDLAIRAGHLEDSTLTARAFFRAQLCLWASEDYVARHGAPKKPEDLARHSIVAFARKLPELRSGRQSFRFPSVGRIVCDNLESTRTYVLRGNGIGMLEETVGAGDGLVRRICDGRRCRAPSLPIAEVCAAICAGLYRRRHRGSSSHSKSRWRLARTRALRGPSLRPAAPRLYRKWN